MKYLLLIFILLASCSMVPVDEDIIVGVMIDVYNQFTYIPDMESWGVDEYWQRREVSQALGGGDCEDYVIWCMEDLWDLGIRTQLTSISYISGSVVVIHAVLRHLDNFYDYRGTALPDEYSIWFSMNYETVMLYAAEGS